MTDVDAIRNLIGRYSHLIDDRRYHDLSTIAIPDVTFDILGQVSEGAEATAALFASRELPNRRGKHITTNSVIEVDGDRATGTTDFVYAGREGDEGPFTVMNAGRYQDTFVRQDGRWLLASRVIRR
jgi:hypothetical protein